jgi:hypothetical protein
VATESTTSAERGPTASPLASHSPEELAARVTREEIEKLLKLAEELTANYEQARWRASLVGGLSILALSFALVAILGMFFPFVFGMNSLSATAQFYAGLLIPLGAYFGASCASCYFRLARKNAIESRALFQLVELIREVEPVLATRDNWSLLDQAQFRIRLARFDIGPKSEPLDMLDATFSRR